MPKSFVLSPPTRKRAHEKAPAGSRGRKGGEEVADNKKPCTPVEAESRDYDRIGLHMYGDNNPTREAAMVLWEFLPAWMAARKIAMTDPEYNKAISRVIAQQAEIVLKAAQEMAGEACESDKTSE